MIGSLIISVAVIVVGIFIAIVVGIANKIAARL